MISQLQNLLYDHDCVVIPNVGAITTTYKPAYYNESSNIFHPPSKQISFNSSLKQDDGLLTNALSNELGIDIKSAKSQVKEFADGMLKQLQAQQKVVLEKVGTLSMKGSEDIVFAIDEEENYFADSYGLESFFIKSLEVEEKQIQEVSTPKTPLKVTPEPEVKKKLESPKVSKSVDSADAKSKEPLEEKKEQKRKKNVLLLVLPLILLLLLIITPVCLYFIADGKYFPGKESLDALFVSTEEEQVNADDENQSTSIEDEYDVAEAQENDVPTATETEPVDLNDIRAISELDERFHIVSGAFSFKANAQRYAKKFSDGRIYTWKKYHVVILGNYNTESEARVDLAKYKAQHGDQVWLMIR